MKFEQAPTWEEFQARRPKVPDQQDLRARLDYEMELAKERSEKRLQIPPGHHVQLLLILEGNEEHYLNQDYLESPDRTMDALFKQLEKTKRVQGDFEIRKISIHAPSA